MASPVEDHPAGGKFKVPSFLVATIDTILKEPESWNSDNEQGQDNPVMEKVGRLLNSIVIISTPPVEISFAAEPIQKSNLEIFG